MPAGDNDALRRERWKLKAKQKQERMNRFRRRREFDHEYKTVQETILKRRRDRIEPPGPTPQQPQQQQQKIQDDDEEDDEDPVPQDDQDEKESTQVMFETMLKHLKNQQIALGAIPGGVEIMPKDESTLQEKVAAMPQPTTLHSNVREPRKKEVLQEWQRAKLKQRKDLLIRLMAGAICVFVVMASLVALAIISWWSFASTARSPPPSVSNPVDASAVTEPSAPPLQHTVLF